MTRKRLFILGFALSVALNLGFLGTIAWHHWQRHTRIDHPHRFHSFYRERFGLHRERAAKMEELRRSVMEKTKPIHQELVKERRELIHLLLEPEPDREEIDKRLKNIQVLQGKIQSIVVEHLLSTKEYLTQKEQRRLFKFILKKMDSHPPPPRMRSR
jgi:Spy/CpxP family protein refolding chaperone